MSSRINQAAQGESAVPVLDAVERSLDLPPVTGIECDSRKVTPGDLFVAIEGMEDDGHHYIEEAVSRGARAVVTEKAVDWRDAGGVELVRVSDAREALAQLASNFYGNPSEALTVIGVTGTNGKTTTVHLIQHLWNHLHDNGAVQGGCGLIGTVKCDTLRDVHPPQLTTPDAVTIARYLSEMKTSGAGAAAMEVSSHALALKRTRAQAVDVGVFTNLKPDHMDFHENMDDYAAAKQRLFSSLSPVGCAVVNQDDPYQRLMLANCQAPSVTFGRSQAADVQIAGWQQQGTRLQIEWKIQRPIPSPNGRLTQPQRFRAAVPLLGDHNVDNVSAAVTVGLGLGFPPAELAEALDYFPGVWRRMQIIDSPVCTVIDDCAHNPASYEAVLSTVAGLDYERLLIINAVRGNRGLRVVGCIARTLARWYTKLQPELMINTACTDQAKPVDAVSTQERDRFLKVFLQGVDSSASEGAVHYHETLQTALERIVREVSPGDLVLLLGPHAMDRAADMWQQLAGAWDGNNVTKVI